MTSGRQENGTAGGGGPKTTSDGGAKATAKGVLILILLMVLAGAGGYFFGTYQKFAPVQYVAPGTPGATELPTGTTAPTTTAVAPALLKKKYWLRSDGYDHVGYAITVHVNGQMVDKIYSPGKEVDITRLVKPGENQIRFEAKLLPPGMRTASDWHDLTIDVIGSKLGPGHDYDRSDVLLKYTRKANETEDYDDPLAFVTLE